MKKENEKIEELSKESLEKEPENEISEEIEADMAEEKEKISSVTTAKSADELIEEAREMVEKSDIEVRDCMEILDEDIEAYEKEKARVLEGSLQGAETLLEKIGFEPEVIEDIEEEQIKFQNEEMVEPMQVKHLSSGRFGAFLLALITGFAVIAAWIYAATEKLGMTLDVTKVPSQEVQNKILSWIGGGITGGEGNPMVGMVILAVSALIAMIVVYKTRVYLREIHNQKVAEKINEEAKFYCSKKEECKKEMEKVSEHIHQVIDSLKTYDIFFDELNAKMRRILHLEGKIPFNEYHPKSKEEIKYVNILISSLKELVTTPMAGENGSLSSKAKSALERSSRVLEQHKEKLYQ